MCVLKSAVCRAVIRAEFIILSETRSRSKLNTELEKQRLGTSAISCSAKQNREELIRDRRGISSAEESKQILEPLQWHPSISQWSSVWGYCNSVQPTFF